MIDENTLLRLADSVTPSDAVRSRIQSRIENRIAPQALLRTVAATEPSLHFVARVKDRVLSSLQPIERAPFFASGFKWTASFAVFILIIRMLPVIFLAPSTSAEAGVQLLPVDGDVSVYIGGVWTDVTSPQMLTSAAMIRTGDSSHATLIINDEGVFRLGNDTLLKLYPSDAESAPGPTATLIRGQLWVLGLVPPVTDGLSIEVSNAVVAVNVGSMSITDDGTQATVKVYDRGATIQHDQQTVFAVTGERVITRGSASLQIATLPTSAFADPDVVKNLGQDAVHRNDIAKLQEDRRAARAGILPTSFLYPAKRLAEQVDVFFTLTQDGRTEKRIDQTSTRLSEALALLKEGQSEEAAVPLAEYKDSLMTLAGDSQDNIVKHLVKKQLADASLTIGTEEESTNLSVLNSALTDVSTVLPDANLNAKDIEGYVLVNRLAQINQQLSQSRDLEGAVSAYAEVRPYLASLLEKNSGMSPLLQKEATSLLVTTSSLLKAAETGGENATLTAFATDVLAYLPPEKEDVLVKETKLTARVQAMYSRIFIFRAPLSRYNQLLVEMADIRGDRDRGTLLRRLKAALPLTLSQYVNTEIKLLGDELKSSSQTITTQEAPLLDEQSGL